MSDELIEISSGSTVPSALNVTEMVTEESDEGVTLSSENATPDSNEGASGGGDRPGSVDAFTSLDNLYEVVSMVSVRQRNQYPAHVPSSCLIDPDTVSETK